MGQQIVLYYLFVAVCFLALAAYNGSFYATYSSDICVSPEEYAATNNTGNYMSSPTMAVTIFYAADCAFALFTCLMIYSCTRRISTDFRKMGFYRKLYGMLIRLFPRLIVVVHYIILIIIIVLLANTFSKETCNSAIHTTTTSSSSGTVTSSTTGVMYPEAKKLCYVDVGFWLGMHILFPIVRRRLRVDSFYYKPIDRDTFFIIRWLFSWLGP